MWTFKICSLNNFKCAAQYYNYSPVLYITAPGLLHYKWESEPPAHLPPRPPPVSFCLWLLPTSSSDHVRIVFSQPHSISVCRASIVHSPASHVDGYGCFSVSGSLQIVLQWLSCKHAILYVAQLVLKCRFQRQNCWVKCVHWKFCQLFPNCPAWGCVILTLSPSVWAFTFSQILGYLPNWCEMAIQDSLVLFFLVVAMRLRALWR